MNVLILSGSPHPDGTTDKLATEFQLGAEEAGHTVTRLDVAKLDIHPCIGCNFCRREGNCVYRDDMSSVFGPLLAADAVAFITPLYYFGMTAQLKSVVDRFFASNKELQQSTKKALLLAAGGDRDEWAMDGLTANYGCICRYFGWEDAGRVLAYGCYVREDIEGSDYCRQARQLGAALR